METIDTITENADLVITEVRAIKRAIDTEHSGDLEAFFAGIRLRQSVNPRLVSSIEGVPAGADSAPALRPESKKRSG